MPTATSRVRTLLEQTPPITTHRCAELLGYSPQHLRRILKAMPEVVVHRCGRSVRYTITTTRSPGRGIADISTGKVGDIEDNRGQNGGLLHDHISGPGAGSDRGHPNDHISLTGAGPDREHSHDFTTGTGDGEELTGENTGRAERKNREHDRGHDRGHDREHLADLISETGGGKESTGENVGTTERENREHYRGHLLDHISLTGAGPDREHSHDFTTGTGNGEEPIGENAETTLRKNREHDRGHGGDAGFEPGKIHRPFPDPKTPRHGDRTNAPRYGVRSTGNIPHGGKDDVHPCRACPLLLASLERDTVQFVVVDRRFRDLLLQQAEVKGWDVRERRSSVYIHLPHLTLQLGGDVVVFYSDEPGDLDWIASWVAEEFTGIYPDIGSLTARIRHPQDLTRDELTVTVHDPATMDAILDQIGMQSMNGVFYLKAPNPNIPAFKVYSTGDTLRCEFDARSNFQAVSALGMRQRLVSLLPDLSRHPGLFWEFLTDYYNPHVQPLIIDTGVDAVVQEFTAVTERLVHAFLEVVRQLSPAVARVGEPQADETTGAGLNSVHDRVTAVVQGVAAMDGWDAAGVAALMTDAFPAVTEMDALVFLGAWSVWASRRFRGQVLAEEVGAMLGREGEPLSAAEVAGAILNLEGAGLMRDDPHLEVCFSGEGVRLGKKLTASREGVG